jgi:hypothetical protein
MKGSVHSRNGIYCHSCHGGDPAQEDQELAMSPQAGFIGIPDKAKMAETCGGCHADVSAMNFYGIPTDQLARYKTSRHGQQLFQKNDQNVASCGDCHGYHDVAPVKDPNSSVYPTKLPGTCNKCHGDAALMNPYGLPTDIYESYKSSVHGLALFEKNDTSAANCASCHGSHGAIPPGVKEIGSTCGKCHVNEKKYFQESVHAKASEEGRFSECISCHGNHGVRHATPDLYQAACTPCHETSSPQFQEGQKIVEMLRTAETRHSEAKETVRQASIKGFFVEGEEASLEEAKSNLVTMAPLQHTLNPDRIRTPFEKVMAAAKEIQTSIARKKKHLQWRKNALIPLWIFIAVMALALTAKHKQLKNRKEKS